MINKNEHLQSKELMPTSKSDRTMSLPDYIILWAGMTINIVAFSLGAQYYNGGAGLSPITMIWVMLIGYGLVTILTALVGDIGTQYGIPFIAYIRAPFGYKGSHLAGFIRALPGLYWFGFLTFIGAGAMNHIMGIIFPGFSNMTLMLILFTALQIGNAMYGVKAMAKFDWIAIPSLGILFSAILVMTLIKYNITIPEIITTPAEGGYSIPFAIAGIAGGWITMALNGSDLSREIERYENYKEMSFFKRNKRALIGQIAGLMFVGVVTMLIGMSAGITTGFWDLNDVIPDLFGNTNTLVLILCYLAVVFAQWSTNTAANLLPPSLVLLNVFPKMKFSISTIICGVLSVAIMPWRIQSTGGFLVIVQNWISQMLGPLIGIMLTDYYLIRKCKLNVHDLFIADGQYKYGNGYNYSAIIALITSFIIGRFTGGYAFFVGLFSSVFIYYFLMKKYTLKKYNQNLGETILLDKKAI